MGRSILKLLLAVFAIALLTGTPLLAKELPVVKVEGSRSLYFLEATSSFGAGGQEVFLMYADAETYTGWARTWGRPASEYPKGLAVDFSGNAIVCGDYGMVRYEEYAAQGGFIVKFSPMGNVVWARDLGWSDHVVFLEDVVCDMSSNIYLTGMAWKFTGGMEPDGGYPVQGFIFTAKLDSNGDMVWAKRWIADERDFSRGNCIATNGSEVVVCGEYNNREGEGRRDIQLLFYNAATGDLNSSQSWGSGYSFWSYANTVAYGASGEIYVGGSILDSPDSEALLLRYSSGNVFQDGQAWGDSGYDSISDLAVLNTTVWGVGYHQIGKRPAEPGDTYEAPIYDGMTLTFDRGLFLGAQKTHDVMNRDTKFSSMAVRSIEEGWIAGHGGLGFNDQLTSPAEGSGYYFSGQVGYPVPWEEQSCGSTALEISGATVTTPFDLSQVRDFMFNENIYLTRINWADPPHKPDVKLKASTTSGPAPLEVTFDAATSFVVNGTVTNYSWQFDSASSTDYPHDTGLNPITTHTFTNPGTYLVSVQVTSDDGSVSWDWVSIFVE